MTGYESIYRGLVSRLLGCDFQEAARRLGLRYVDGGIQVSFLNRDYRITVEGAEPLDGQPVNANNRRVLLYYLLSRGSGDPENCFVLFESLFPRKVQTTKIYEISSTPSKKAAVLADVAVVAVGGVSDGV